MEFLVCKLQMKTIEKVVEEKYSKNHSRIFRILDNLGYLDEKQVLIFKADILMLLLDK